MKEFDLQRLIRPHILTLKPYSSARDEYSGSEGIFLDANENPLGSVNGGAYNRYPDPLQEKVKKKLANLKQVSPKQIFLGNGSDEPIDLLFRAFVKPGRENVIALPPTYGMYEVCASINDVEVRNVPLTPAFQIETENVLQAVDEHTKIIFVCSPNNPTGNLIEKEAVLALLQGFHGLVVVDEAYIDFAQSESTIEQLGQFPNLVVLQTFSKAWGLAALRLGVAYASEEIVAILNKIKAPYNITTHTQETALKALENVGEKEQMVQEIVAQRDLLAKELSALEVTQQVFPSDANFLLVQVDDAKEVYSYLVDNKIIVRDRSKVILCDESLRITVGTAQENEHLVKAFKAYGNR